jgi:hypothetical protein
MVVDNEACKSVGGVAIGEVRPFPGKREKGRSGRVKSPVKGGKKAGYRGVYHFLSDKPPPKPFPRN